MAEARRIVVTGATGSIGQRLVPELQRRGFRVRALVRSVERAARVLPPQVELFAWDPGREELPPAEAFAQVWGVCNLAGAPISRRWTPAVKAQIVASRVELTRRLVRALQQWGQTVQVLVSTSAVGYYGDCGEELCREERPPGKDFLAKVCEDWEAAAQEAAPRVRVVCLRLGVVLDPRAGALVQLLPVMRSFLGGTLGSGQQWFPWVHWADVVAAFAWALETPTASGAYNVAAPGIVRFREFCRELARLLGRPCWLRVPVWALRLRYGELADALVASQRAEPFRLRAEGFQFAYARLEEALGELLGTKFARASSQSAG
jgi:uncharacterized protein (TIGR01777 family)